ncbi:MAG: ComF family protein [Gammaproteobacteria bacterium]|nr:ComF family protein [Gammaproteobacteria bacterium]
MELARRLLSNLFPSRCILCSQTIKEFADGKSIELCASCYLSQPFNTVCCVRCALPLADESNDSNLCGRCITKLPAYDYAHSIFRYEDDVIGLVHQLKFSEKITYARSFGEMLLTVFESNEHLKKESPDCLLPVPLHSSRLRQRGFNQSIEISRVISKKLRIPIEHDAIIRQRKTTSQTGLNAKQRRINIKGAFVMAGSIQHKHVLIIDDVVTTGSTVNELAILLKKNNVERVGVLSIARAPLKA